MEEPKDKKEIREKAINHLVVNVPVAKVDEDLHEIIDKLREFKYEYGEYIYVFDLNDKLAGYITTSKILSFPTGSKAGDIMNKKIPYAFPYDDQEKVATLAVEHKKTAIPIVDEKKRMIGVIPSLAIIQILREEHIEDMDLLAGIVEKNKMARTAIESSPGNRVKERMSYLFLGLGGSLIATLVMSGFEEVLDAHVALAFFIPGLVYLADAVGTQTFTVVVRGLTLNDIKFSHLLKKEFLTGFLIGLILGLILFGATLLFFGDFNLALTVSLALIVAGTMATTIGLLLPWILHKLNKDPALGSGPLATILVDILSLIIYFLIAQALVL